MLNRLKSLPLTIILSVMIWMYAEAQFTATQENIRLSIKLVSPTPDLAVRTTDPLTGRSVDTINAVVTLQGPRNQLDAIFQQSITVTQDDELASLTYVPREKDLHPGDDTTIDVASLIDNLPYFKDRRVTVVSAAPGRVAMHADRAASDTLNNVPVWASGPPALLARYDIDINPRTLTLTIAGPPAAIAALRANPRQVPVHAYLDLSADDYPSPTATRRKLRYTLPEGLTLHDAPQEVDFRLTERPTATQPSAAP